MKVVITQPNYLPWLGYFSQLNSCDLWVVLDDVQYARREWQNRNRILDLFGNPQYLSLPIQKSPRSSLINQILLSISFHPHQHLEKLKSYYLNAPFFDAVFPFIENILKNAYIDSGGYMATLNTLIISQVCQYFGIYCDIVTSSSLSLDLFEAQSASQKLLKIVKHFNASSYLSSVGAKDYMNSELYLFKEAYVQVLWQNFAHKPYYQGLNQGSFVSHLSFVDYLFNCGPEHFKSYLDECHHEST